MSVVHVLHRDVVDVAAPLQPDATPRAGERWVPNCSKEALDRACVTGFAAPLTIDAVGGSNVYVTSPAGHRGVVAMRNLVALWRREESES